MANARIKNAVTYQALPVSSASATTGDQLTTKSFTDENYLSFATNPGVTYTGTMVDPIFGIARSTMRLLYLDGTRSSSLPISRGTSISESLLTSVNFGSSGQILNNFSYVPILTSITANNALDITLFGVLWPSVTSLSFPAVQTFQAIGTYATLTSISLPNALMIPNFTTIAPLCTTLNCPLVSMGGTLGFTMNSLTTISFPSLVYTSSFTPTATSVTTLSLPLLVLVSAGNFTINFPVLTSCSVPSLVSVLGAFTATLALCTSFSFPSLVDTVGFSVTLASLTTLSLPSLTTNTGSMTLSASVATSVSFPALTNVTSTFTATNLPLCTTFSFPALLTSGPLVWTLPSVTTLSIPSLTTMNNSLTLIAAAATSISFAALTTIIGAVSVTGSPLCTSFSLPVLTNCSGVFGLTLAAVTTLTLTSLATITTNLALSCAALTTFSLPALISVGTTFVITAANLVTFSIGSTLKSIGGNFTMSGMKLDQASVDGILVRLAALDGTNGTTAYSSKTILLNGGTSATPGATGITAKATLVARGCTVTTN